VPSDDDECECEDDDDEVSELSAKTMKGGVLLVGEYELL